MNELGYGVTSDSEDPNAEVPTPQGALQKLFGMAPRADRLAILPRYSKATGWVAPQALYGALSGFVAPQVAAQGGAVTPEDAQNVAMTAMGGGTAFNRAPAGALGTFIGSTSKSFDAWAKLEAARMAELGISPREIWAKTGNWKSPEGRWLQEISDHNMVMQKNTPPKWWQLNTGAKDFSKVVSHPELERAYPDIVKNTRVELTPSQDKRYGVTGYYQHAMPTTTTNIENAAGKMLLGRTPYDKNLINITTHPNPPQSSSGAWREANRGTMVHELQHAIQRKEHLVPGTNPDYLASSLFKKMVTGNSTPEDMATMKRFGGSTTEAAYDQYLRNAGEAMARASSERRNLLLEQRRFRFPEDSYDVPINSLRLEDFFPP